MVKPPNADIAVPPIAVDAAPAADGEPAVPGPPEPHPEGRRIKVLKAFYRPTQKERAEHDTTHIPFRSWCDHCVMGRGKSAPHNRRQHDDEDAHTIPIIFNGLCIYDFP